MNARVLAVIVSFQPELNSLADLVKIVSKQVVQTIIVDNGSANVSEIEQLVSSVKSTVELVALGDNKGLGTAHNVGIQRAIDGGFTHVLLLDQDSLPQADMVERLVQSHEALEKKHKVSAVGASYLNSDNGSQSFFVQFGKLKFKRQVCASSHCGNELEADFLISSGSLFSVESLKKIGLMEEGLFIDHIDTEWFLRARSKSYKAFGVCNALMLHGLGEKTHQIRLIRKRNVPQHKPFRYYYIFRNSVLLYKRGYCSALWKWNDVQRLFMIFVMYGLICSPRLQHLKMMCLGLKHGLQGKTGKLVD